MIEKRICYYTRKVNEFGQSLRKDKVNKYRFDRLMNYKKAMHERIGRY